MTDDQRNAIRKALVERTQEAMTTKKKARDFLIREGFYTRDGSLAETYGGKKTATR